jgi:hypothetical protein
LPLFGWRGQVEAGTAIFGFRQSPFGEILFAIALWFPYLLRSKSLWELKDGFKILPQFEERTMLQRISETKLAAGDFLGAMQIVPATDLPRWAEYPGRDKDDRGKDKDKDKVSKKKPKDKGSKDKGKGKKKKK